MRIVDFARYAVCRSFGDREVFKWTGSHDRIRLLADLRADASFATAPVARPASRQVGTRRVPQVDGPLLSLAAGSL
jgi:hypothetical protein